MAIHPLLLFVVAFCAAHVGYALFSGVAYPLGAGWFAVRRAERPFGYWGSIAMYALMGTAFLFAGLGNA